MYFVVQDLSLSPFSPLSPPANSLTFPFARRKKRPKFQAECLIRLWHVTKRQSYFLRSSGYQDNNDKLSDGKIIINNFFQTHLWLEIWKTANEILEKMELFQLQTLCNVRAEYPYEQLHLLQTLGFARTFPTSHHLQTEFQISNGIRIFFLYSFPIYLLSLNCFLKLIIESVQNLLSPLDSQFTNVQNNMTQMLI